MKKWLLSLCMVLTLVACKEEKKQTAQVKPIIKIGVIYPMSGEYAHFGDAMKTAVKMFETDEKTINSAFKYKFLIEDGAFSTSRSAVVAKKLIDIDKVDIIITLSSDIGSVVSPIAQKNKVIHLSMATELNVAKGEYNFTISTPPNKNTEKMVEALQKLNFNRIAFIIQNTAMMQSVAEPIRQAGHDGSINIISDNTINSGERDFRLLIHKILENKPDAMIVQLQPPELQIFVKQLREINKDILITSVESFGYPEDKTLFEGTWYSGAVVPTKAYSTRFKEFTGLNSTDFSELFYVAMEVIRAAYTTTDKTTVINNIINLTMNSFSIGNVSFNQDGVMQADAYLYTIRNGQIEVAFSTKE
ncbi:MAG: ABC transporter substrate-binding protein [Alphaproteobacteria bacterium]|nr:ABC transporter substrate-binding protein [Alphaproteobacteria bacterium]